MLAIIFFWLLRLAWLYPFTPDKLWLTEVPVKSDAVVVVSGGWCREEFGLTLVKQGYAPQMFISGIRDQALVRRIRTTLRRYNGSSLIVEPNSTSTFSDALYTKRLARINGWKRIILVTSPTHSLRALWIFRKVLPEVDVHVVTVPASMDGFDVAKAKQAGTQQNYLFVSEQRKFLAYYFLHSWRFDYSNFEETLKLNSEIEKLRPQISAKARKIYKIISI